MLFEDKIERAMEYRKNEMVQQDSPEENRQKEEHIEAFDNKSQRKLKKVKKDGDLSSIMEKGDLKAMMISAYLVLMPVAIGVLLLICGFTYWFFLRGTF